MHCISTLSKTNKMTKYKNKYRIESTRLQNWNYGDAALYFVTICTKNRLHYFGEIDNGIMKPSVLGEIVISEWIKTFEIRKDMNLSMGEFVVMPNHFHAIIGIGENIYNGKDAMHRVSTSDKESMHRVSTSDKESLHRVSTSDKDATHRVSTCVSTFGAQSKNLASIIRGFKSSVTVFARKNNIDFQWQPLFHDHIIRNEKSFLNISNYIINNPLNWKEDNFFKSE